MIEAIERRMQREGLTESSTPVLGDDDDPKLPPDARPDAVLIVDAFHEMAGSGRCCSRTSRARSSRRGASASSTTAKAKAGRGPDAAERVPPSVVISQAAAAGLKLVEQHKFLPYQYFLIFGK